LQKDAQAKMVEERAKLASKAQKEIGPKVERVRKIEVRVFLATHMPTFRPRPSF